MKKKVLYVRISLLLTLLWLIAGFSAYGQGYLEKKITLHVHTTKLGQVLDTIAHKGQFYFSYSSGILPADSLVSLPHFSGTIREALKRLLGGSYDFQESNKHVILRPTPFRLTLMPEEVDEKRKQYAIRGYVIDEKTGKGIYQASVYEKHLLSGTLTNKKGYFKLKVKSSEHVPVAITVSKALYKDTTTVFLPAAHLDGKNQTEIKNTYFSNSGSQATNTFFGRLLLGSRQKINALNIGNFFAYTPVQVSILPGLSSHGIMSGQIVNKASYNFLGGYTAGVDGIELAGLFNINRAQVRYVQAAGIFNIAGGNLSGVQLSGIFNAILDSVSGIQAAGVFNSVKNNVRGIQLAGLANKSSTMKGLQVAGLFNYSKDLSGVQLAGLLNKTQNNVGLQIGLVNVADTSQGVSIGLLNFIGNGFKRLSFFTNENAIFNLGFKSGTPAFYSLIEGGIGVWDGQERYLLGFGIGHEFNRKKKNSYFSIELLSQQQLKKNNNQDYWVKTNLLYNFRVGKRTTFYIAPSFNIIGLTAMTATSNRQSIPFDDYPYLLDKTQTKMWMGIGLGVSFF